MRRLSFLLVLVTVSSAALVRADDQPAPAPAPIMFEDHGDPVLKAMVTELKRSQEKLQLGQMERPYYIDYQVTDLQDYQADATLGALREEQLNAGRLVRVVVRIGGYKQDSYFGEGTGSTEIMPMDNNEMALRHQLWLATDKAYKAALSGLTEKQAALKNVVTENDVADFSQERPTQFFHELANLDADQGSWKELLRSTSGFFRQEPSLESSNASLHFRVLNRYFVNTEGAVLRSGTPIYYYGLSASAQADDGLRIDRNHGYVVTRPEELPGKEQIEKDARKLIASFAELRKAPLVEDDYRGPVLFSADAATALFERLVAPNILGLRPELGTSARTRGDYNSYFKSRVLPEFFTVIDDPSARKIDGVTLAGSYDVDDEGVAAQKVTVIDKGVLVNYLLDRQPIRDFPHSNGHGRSSLAAAPRPQISNLIFTASNSIPFNELKARLIQMCKDQGRPYGYYVETTGPQLAPRLLWRVYANDGHMELVRGAVFKELDARALRNEILAAGNETYVYNRIEPVPSSIVGPSLLFNELDIQRANRTREKLPQYPAPQLSSQK
jgi:TldD protein